MSKILEPGFESVVLTLLGQLGFACYGGDAFDPDAAAEAAEAVERRVGHGGIHV